MVSIESVAVAPITLKQATNQKHLSDSRPTNVSLKKARPAYQQKLRMYKG
jgi:hypothetical protein